MTALQLQLLIAVARTVRDMASNPLASVGTARLSEAPGAVRRAAPLGGEKPEYRDGVPAFEPCPCRHREEPMNAISRVAAGAR